MRRFSLTLALALPLLCCTACAFSPDPERRNTELVGVAPLLSAGALEVVAELPAPPGNLAVADDGRVFFTFHPEAGPDTPARVAELLPDGSVRPFPSQAWQRPREGPHFVTPLGVRIDSRQRLWVLDHGDYGDETPALYAFDLKTRALVHRFDFPDEVAGWGSMLNDLVVDAERGWVYLAEPGPYTFDPALVVYSIERRRAWRVLEDSDPVSALDQHLVVQGRFMKVFGMSLQIAIDTIALSPDGETLFFGPLSGDQLYRLPTAPLRALASQEPDDDALLKRVGVLGRKPISDGGVAGARGEVYLTAIEHDALAVLRAEGRLESLVQSPELLAWPDGLALSADGRWLYATVSELHHVIGVDSEEVAQHAPFRIVRVELPE